MRRRNAMALSDEEQAARRKAACDVMLGSPYISGLNLHVERWDEEGVRMRMPFDARFTNDGKTYHGGAVAALFDTTGAAAVWAGHDFDKGARAATVSMTINYTGAARGVDLIGEGSCVRRGRDLSFSEIRVSDPDGKLVATGTLVYRIVP
jgi:uncharacterized protein (TIGR00369 family)